MINHDSKILVVGGAGTMGSSTALELARRGYRDVQVLDMFQPPSANSAGNDVNKMISTQYVEGIWGRLAFEAWEAWDTDPLFKPYLHKAGRLDIATLTNEPRINRLSKQLKLAEGSGRTVEWLEDQQAILHRFPMLSPAGVKGKAGIYVRDAGWVAARDALKAVGHELERLGVKAAYGPSGTFESLLLDRSGTCVGVRTVGGIEWAAELVVFAAGAWSPALLDLEGQCVSKCWQYAHLRLTQKEVESLRDTPTLYDSEVGFFMRPSDDGYMKIVNEFEGYTHHEPCQPFGSSSEQTLSVPRSHALHPDDTIPDEGRQAIQNVVDTFLPHLSGRPLVDCKLCWCTDSTDGNWLMCEHPRFPNVVLATGDSGHTFKMLPIVGKYVVDLIEDKMSQEDRDLWRWRPEVVGKVQARPGPASKDLSSLSGWNGIRCDQVNGHDETL